jgi:hypothetical protein
MLSAIVLVEEIVEVCHVDIASKYSVGIAQVIADGARLLLQ